MAVGRTLLVALVAGVLVSCAGSRHAPGEAASPPAADAPAATTEVERRPFRSVVVVEAVVQPAAAHVVPDEEGVVAGVQPDGWTAVATVSAVDRYRIGPAPDSSELTLELPTGRAELPCASLTDRSASVADDEEFTMEQLVCSFETDEFLVAGLQGRLRVVAAELEDALVVPAGSLALDRGSLSAGTVVVEGDGGRRTVEVRVRSFDGLSVAVHGALRAGDAVVDPHP